MFSLLENKDEIAKAQRKLETTIRREFKRKVIKNIGYPGGTTFDANVSTNGNYWYWSEHYNGKDKSNPRRLNWFGLFREDTDLQISVEINVPYEGRNGQVAGFFARNNDTGAIYLMHSGRVGGGTEGVGKATFLAWSDQTLINVVDSTGNMRVGVVVMPVEGIAATHSAIRYIDTIAHFKQAVRAGETNTPEFKEKQKEFEDFYSESRGQRTGKRATEIDYLSRHGDVVDALKDWRNTQPFPKTARIVKNAFIDLGVAEGQKLVEVYEVKTSSARTNLYSAIGQLMTHGTVNNCQRVIVLPQKDKIPTDLTNALQRLGIKLLKFKLDEETATIL